MTVLSVTKPKELARGFPIRGRYSYVAMLLDFAEWGVDLPWVRARIACVTCGDDFAELFGAIIVVSQSKAGWCKHPKAKAILLAQCLTLVAAWDKALAASHDRDQLALEYLADALKSFAKATATR